MDWFRSAGISLDYPELERLAGPNSVPYRRATEYPPADLELLTAPDVGAWIDDLGITSCCFPETLSGVNG